jgi:hypothetical protein
MTGKPSIELATVLLPHMGCSPTARADFIVFLKRSSDGPPVLAPYRKEVARHFMRQVLYGTTHVWRSPALAIDRTPTRFLPRSSKSISSGGFSELRY